MVSVDWFLLLLLLDEDDFWKDSCLVWCRAVSKSCNCCVFDFVSTVEDWIRDCNAWTPASGNAASTAASFKAVCSSDVASLTDINDDRCSLALDARANDSDGDEDGGNDDVSLTSFDSAVCCCFFCGKASTALITERSAGVI